MALKVGELYASFGIDSSGLNSAISDIEKKCSSIAKGLAVTGAAMTATVTRSVVNAAKSVYESGTTFHAQMSKVGAIANASAEDLETLTQKALEMGSTTSFTAKEAGDAMEYMAMAGWKTGEMLDGIKPIMDLAAASGESLGTTSDIVTDALTAMGYSAKDAEHFANVMAAASTNANTNVSMMGESFKYVAPLAGTLGYSIDDLAVAMGVMANSGIKSSQAGTSLARILQNMIEPSKEAQAAMKELGLSLYDSEGKSKSLMQVMQDMRAAAKGNGVDMAAIADSVAELDLRLENGEISEREYMDQMTKLTGVSKDFMASVADLAGTRGLSGMLAIMNASDEDFAKLVDAIANCDGALDEMVAKMLDNALGDMILFESAVDGLRVSLWDLVEGPFRGIVKNGTKVVQMLTGLDESTKMAAIKTAGLAAAAGPAMTALGGLVGMAGKLLPFLSAMASPLAVVGAGLGLFAVAAVDADNNIGKMLQNLSKNARKQLNKFDTTISKSMRTVSDRMPKLTKSVISSIRTLMPGLMNTGMLAIDGFVQAISSNASNLAGIGKEIITQIVGGITRYAPYLIPDAVGMIGNIATSLINNLPSYAHSVIELGKSLLTGLKNVNWSEIGLNLLRSVVNAASGIAGELRQLFEDAKTAILTTDWGEVWENIKSTFIQGGNIIKEALLGDNYTEDSTWSDVGSKIWTDIKNGFKEVADFGKMLVLGDDYTPDATWGQVGSKIATAIKTKLGKASDLLKEFVLGDDYTPDASWGTVGKKIWDTIKSGIGKATDLLAGLILGEDYSPDDSWSQVGGKIWEKIKSGFKATAGWLKTLILGEGNEEASWSSVGEAILAGITTSLSNISDTIKGWIVGDGNWGEVGTAVVKGIHEKMKNIGSWIKTKIEAGRDLAATIDWSSIWDNVLSFSAGLKDGAFSLAEDIIGWVGEKLSTLGQEGSNFSFGDMTNVAESLIDAIVNSKVNLLEKGGPLLEKLAKSLADFSWDGVGTSVSSIASHLIEAIAGAMHVATDAAGSVMDGVGEILSGENGSSMMDACTNIAKSIVTGIANELPGLVDDASSLVSKMGELIGKLPWETMGTDLGDLGTTIIEKATQAIDEISTNGGFSGMVSSVGEGMVAAVDGISTTIGIFVGKIAGYLLNPENLASMAEAGAKLAWEVIKGYFTSVYKGAEALGTGVSNLLVGITRGVFDVEVDPVIEAKQIEFSQLEFDMGEAGEMCGFVLMEHMASAMASTEQIDAAVAAWDKVVESGFAEYFPEYEYLGNEAAMSLFKGIANAISGDAAVDDSALAQLALLYASGFGNALITAIDGGALGDGADALSTALANLLEGNEVVNISEIANASGIEIGAIIGQELPEGISLGISNGKLVLIDAFGAVLDEAAESIENGYGFNQIGDLMANAWNTAMEVSFGKIEDLNIKWDLADMFAQMGFDASDIMNMDFSGIDFSALVEKIKSEEITVQEAAMALITGVNETIQSNPVSVDGAVDATIGETTKAEITAQAEQTSNTIAAAFNTLPADIQADVAEAMTSMITVISGNQGPTEVACQAIVTAAEGILTAKSGHSIGSNFTSGMAAGINDGLGSIIAAARRVANAAVTVFRQIWRERSPSRLARNDLAFNFDKGLELGLEDGISGVATASRRVADTVTDQLYLADPSRDTVHTARQSAQETEAAMMRVASVRTLPGKNEKGEQQRLVQVTLVLDGQVVGSTIAPLVDEAIGADITTRR